MGSKLAGMSNASLSAGDPLRRHAEEAGPEPFVDGGEQDEQRGHRGVEVPVGHRPAGLVAVGPALVAAPRSGRGTPPCSSTARSARARSACPAASRPAPRPGSVVAAQKRVQVGGLVEHEEAPALAEAGARRPGRVRPAPGPPPRGPRAGRRRCGSSGAAGPRHGTPSAEHAATRPDRDSPSRAWSLSTSDPDRCVTDYRGRGERGSLRSKTRPRAWPVAPEAPYRWTEAMSFERMWAELTPLGRSVRTGGYFRQPYEAAEVELRHWFVGRGRGARAARRAATASATSSPGGTRAPPGPGWSPARTWTRCVTAGRTTVRWASCPGWRRSTCCASAAWRRRVRSGCRSSPRRRARASAGPASARGSPSVR